jgi:cellulose synthase/poly-beta-1,6-N-acetylglucosamine synthase-like glycosyltransferase
VFVEILEYFAIAALLATFLCFIRGAAAWPWWLALPAVGLALAAAGEATALLAGDPTGAAILGGVAALVCAVFRGRLQAWGALAASTLALLVLAGLAYLTFAVELTATQASGAVFVVLSTLLLAVESLALLLSVSYAFEILDVLGRRAPPPAPPRSDGAPMVALQVPTYNEPFEIVRETLWSLARLDYPAYMVQVVDNNTPDPATWQPLQQLCEQLGPRFQFMHLENWPGYKAGALNEATRRLPASVEVIAVIDADFVVDPGFLTATAPQFTDPRVTFVQTAQHYRDWQDDPYLRGLFYSYRYFFDVSMVARAHANAIIFCGTMGLIRRTALERLGGWNEDCVTEDSECSLRMLALGGVGVYDPRPWGAGLMPLSFDGLKKQRFRWALGGMQMLRLHWRELIPLWPHRLRLTPAQRLHYLLGCTQWFGDLLTTGFTLMLVGTAVAAAAHHQLPIRQIVGSLLLIPVAFLAGGVLRAVWALRRATGCSLGDAVRALRVWFALAWVVSLACVRGLVRRGAAFLRTPKRRESEGTMVRALRYSLGETTLAIAAVAAGVAMLVRAPSLSTGLLCVLLAFEAFVFSNAPWASVATERIAMTPTRRAFLRSAQSTGDRPSRGPALTALGAAGVAAAVMVLATTFVAATPSGPPVDASAGPPSLGTLVQANASPTATPSPGTPALGATPTAGAPPSQGPSPSPSPAPIPTSPPKAPSPTPAPTSGG